jgi:hypothetical protein
MRSPTADPFRAAGAFDQTLTECIDRHEVDKADADGANAQELTKEAVLVSP